jgi:hypothetical protein
MKKRIFLALIISALLTSSATVYAGNETESTDTTPKYVLGDIDSNGKITTTDYLKLKSHFWGSENLKGTAFAMADVNFDGELTVSDYAKIKDSMLGEYALDDSSWAEYEGKAEVVGTGEFALQFNGNAESAISSSDIITSDKVISDGIMHYPEGYYGSVQKERTFINYKGEEIKLKHSLSNTTPKGELTFWYKDENYNTYYFNENGESVGLTILDDALEHFETDVEITKEEAISIGLKNAQKIWKGKTFEMSDMLKTSTYGYRFFYYVYVNGIKTTDSAEIWLTNYGELRGYLYHDTDIKDYDLRSFNVNDDVSLYSEKIVQLGMELISNDKFASEYFGENIDKNNIEIIIGDPMYGIGADGKLAGFVSVEFKNKETGNSRTEFVGFHALEKE